jgi:SAM-dependent methyltransferase
MEKWLHKKVAADLLISTLPPHSVEHKSLSTLEIGAGTLNHLAYEHSKIYDIVEPFKVLFENSPDIIKINKVYNLIEDIPFEKSYDRIISCAVCEHLENLPFVIAKSAMLLKEGGCFRASVPSQGGFLWRLSYTLTTGIEFRLKYGLDYNVIMKHEHLNNVDEIEQVIEYFFKNVKKKRFGIGKHFSFYTFFEGKDADIGSSREYLDL